MSIAQAIFAAGCFWGVQTVFDAVPGVESTQVGYIGGKIDKPTYETVCSDKTGHAEAILITYNPSIVSYNELLDIFFESHNPTTLNRQGPDIGTQYRSSIFYKDEIQKKLAEKKIEELTTAQVYKAPIITKIEKAEKFYPAEEYHQKYLEKKGQSTCTNCPSKTKPYMPEDEIKSKLTPEQYKVLREKGTEKAFTGKLLNNKEDGTYTCAVCNNPIFPSDAKFDSGSGWPSFDKAIPGGIILKPDYSHNMIRTEVTCARCGSHLGHLFDDGPTKTGARFCINSISMEFDKKE